ncbi:hypothetical protein K6W76_21435 [Burkholderia anthina]|uniref:hypothetical protein n=1 Tax=Burkholderia anthina TaxID=179879 RepID=UPI00158CB104|nr:hypothetical protein [Burkholderia anthina]MBY4869044.1 hypothetical protein [Burkholderia anthina]
MTVSRDDFSQSVKTILAGRAGWKCSFPNCPCSTAGPAIESHDKWIRNGVAAHITAAAPGGPRYDASMSPEQRSDISNAIWMCPTHGSLIDKEKTAYTVEEIKSWKIAAESRATRELEYGSTTHPSQTTSRYSSKDTAILASYSEVMPYHTIELIRSEPFGSFVKHDVTNPLYQILDMKGNPRYKFQDPILERLRQTLTSEVEAFFRHFGQQSGGLTTGYEYINVSEFSRGDPESRPYWEEQIYETQRLAHTLCSTAMQLLEIKENN